MRYEIEIKQTISKYTTYAINVEDEQEGEDLSEIIKTGLEECIHPDDVMEVFKEAGCEVLSVEEGEELAEFEIY